MYVVMAYFVFLEAMEYGLIHDENISHLWNSCFLLHFTLLWARVRMGHVCPSFARNPTMPLCFICFSLCDAIHLMDRMDVIVSCMIFQEPMSLLKPPYGDGVGLASYVHTGMHSSGVHGL